MDFSDKDSIDLIKKSIESCLKNGESIKLREGTITKVNKGFKCDKCNRVGLSCVEEIVFKDKSKKPKFLCSDCLFNY